jgi:Uma2 family endonuclease
MRPVTMNAPRYVEEWPDHTGLPDEDGMPAQSSQEFPQSNILTESFESRLRELHPDGNYWVASDVGIYFDYTDLVLAGCRAPDWFYVPGVPTMLHGKLRRSLVMWKELVRPYLLIEYVGGDGSEERDRTPGKGKFWIYENAIGAGYYVIFDPRKHTLEVFAHDGEGYRVVAPNQAGRFLIEGLGLELGIWDGTYRNMTAAWLRVWDPVSGKMVCLPDERLEIAIAKLKKQRSTLTATTAALASIPDQTDDTRRLVTAGRERLAFLAAQFRVLGIDPDA